MYVPVICLGCGEPVTGCSSRWCDGCLSSTEVRSAGRCPLQHEDDRQGGQEHGKDVPLEKATGTPMLRRSLHSHRRDSGD